MNLKTRHKYLNGYFHKPWNFKERLNQLSLYSLIINILSFVSIACSLLVFNDLDFPFNIYILAALISIFALTIVIIAFCERNKFSEADQELYSYFDGSDVHRENVFTFENQNREFEENKMHDQDSNNRVKQKLRMNK